MPVNGGPPSALLLNQNHCTSSQTLFNAVTLHRLSPPLCRWISVITCLAAYVRLVIAFMFSYLFICSYVYYLCMIIHSLIFLVNRFFELFLRKNRYFFANFFDALTFAS